jgi:hypothetical protein
VVDGGVPVADSRRRITAPEGPACGASGDERDEDEQRRNPYV